jgi:uncharacterized protein (TIGR02145 family)
MKLFTHMLAVLLVAALCVSCSEQEDLSNPTAEDMSSLTKKPSTAPSGPTINSISADSAEIGDEIIIYGSDFGPKYKYATNYVLVHGVKARVYYSWSKTEIRLPLPSGSALKTGPIVVVVNSVESNAESFTIAASTPITIGTGPTAQTWSGANLISVEYADNTPIEYVEDPVEWATTTEGAWCYYNNDDQMGPRFGILYNWYAVNDQTHGGIKLASNERIPTDADWTQLAVNLGVDPIAASAMGWIGTDEGGKLKEVGNSTWCIPNEGATNSTGFTALPTGARGVNGSFSLLDDMGGGYIYGYYGYFWTKSQYTDPNYPDYGFYRGLYKHNAQIIRGAAEAHHGFAIRTILDNN